MATHGEKTRSTMPSVQRSCAVGVFVLAGLVALTGCHVFDSKSCTLVGCSDSVTATIEIPVAPSDLNGVLIEVCRNDECASGSIVTRKGLAYSKDGGATEYWEISNCSSGASSDGGRFSCNWLYTMTETGVVLTISYQPAGFTDGDRYRIRATDASGEKVYVSREGTVAHYDKYYPNGEDCDGDYYCRTASF